MPFVYKKSFSGDIKPLIDKAKVVAPASGVHFSGDENCGMFHGKTFAGEVCGSYEVRGGIITITVNKKPLLVSEIRIKTALNKYFT
jgi:hypothetical protein